MAARSTSCRTCSGQRARRRTCCRSARSRSRAGSRTGSSRPPKPARAFLKALDLPRPIAECWIREIGATPEAAHLAALLAPAREGHDVGLVSDAGCPGVADPGALVVAAAHAAGLARRPARRPVVAAARADGVRHERPALRLPRLPARRRGRSRRGAARLEAESRAQHCTQLFIETPYRNVALLATRGLGAVPGHAAVRGRRSHAAHRIGDLSAGARVARAGRDRVCEAPRDLPAASLNGAAA